MLHKNRNSDSTLKTSDPPRNCADCINAKMQGYNSGGIPNLFCSLTQKAVACNHQCESWSTQKTTPNKATATKKSNDKGERRRSTTNGTSHRTRPQDRYAGLRSPPSRRC